MAQSQVTKSGQKKLSEVARHIERPSGIVSTGWPAVCDRLKQFGIPFDVWQQGAGRLILAKRADGIYAAGIGGVIISIPRQVGKTYTIGWIAFALCSLMPGMTVIWTAHHTRTSNETFGKMRAMARKPNVAPYIESVRAANGEQSVIFTNKSRILFGARDQGFGLGFDKVDILVLDEAQRVKEVAMADMVPATNAAPNGLVILMGTPPRPTDNGDVFTNRRADALAGDPDTLYIELSADQGAKIIDWDQVAKANPSYPHRTGKTSILRMQKLVGSDEGFYREGYGIWDDASAGSEFPAGTWSAAARERKLKGPLKNPVVAIDVRLGVDQSIALGVVGEASDGPVAVVARFEERRHEQWSDEQIVGWVIDELEKRGIERIAIDAYGENGPLIPLLEDAGLELVKFNTIDMRNACMSFHSGILNGEVHHLSEKPLNTAVAGARRRVLNDGWRWSRTDSKTNISPLLAVAEAWWIYTTDPDYDVMDSFG